MTFAHYNEAALHWDAAGRPQELLIQEPWPLLAFHIWIFSSGGSKEPITKVLSEFHNASVGAADKAQLGWYEDMLRERHYCETCGETYRLANLSVCCGCLRTYCYQCNPYERAPNGNFLHHCGGEIVG